MKKSIPILIFIVGQLAALAILTLWIVWYSILPSPSPVWWLIQGILLMIPVIGGTTFIFLFWNKSRMLDRERSRFISSVSHELLTPLASLRLYLETMLMRDLSKEKRQHFLELMLEDSERLSTLISQILTASKIERGKAPYELKPVNFSEVVENFIEDNKMLLKDADFTKEIDTKCNCLADVVAMNTVLKNLIENAIKYSPEKASISLKLKKGRNIQLTVCDNGEGLEKKELSNVFKEFYRATDKVEGTGLGLYIVKNVVLAHRGKVKAVSEGKGKGLCVNIQLPSIGRTGMI